MKLSKFKFNLPSELIALHPAKNRDESRLMLDLTCITNSRIF